MARDDKEAKRYVSDYMEKINPNLGRRQTFPPVDTGSSQHQQRWEQEEDKRLYIETLENYDELGYKAISCSWAQVFEQLDLAQQAKAESEGKDKDWYVRYRRSIADLSKILAPGLAAIPDELNLLHGGLAVIFNVAHHREKNRVAILRAFEDMPEIVAMASKKCQNFPDDPALRSAMEGLKAVLLKEIPHLVNILAVRHISRKLMSSFQGTSIENSLLAVRRSADRVKECAQDARDDVMNQMHVETGTIQLHVERIHQGVHDLYDQYGEIDYRMGEMTQRQHYMFQQLAENVVTHDDMFQMLKDIVFKFINPPDVSPMTSRPSSPFLQEDWNFNWGSPRGRSSAFPEFLGIGRTPQPRSPRPRSPSYPEDPNVPPSPLKRRVSSHDQLTALLAKLNVSRKGETYDLNVVIHQSGELGVAAQEKAAYIQQTEKFHKWLAEKDSALLHVEAQLDSVTLGKTSPMSFFCANLIRVFQAMDLRVAVVLHFFCGQHFASNSRLQGPKGLITSLLAQLIHALLDNWPEYHSGIEIDLGELLSNDNPIPTEMQLQLIRALLGHVPPQTTVFCVVDDISRFEKQEWSAEYWALINLLNDIIYNQEATGAKFKLLMTSPTWSRWLKGKVPTEQLLELADRGHTSGIGSEKVMRSHTRAVVESVLLQMHE